LHNENIYEFQYDSATVTYVLFYVPMILYGSIIQALQINLLLNSNPGVQVCDPLQSRGRRKGSSSKI